MKTRRAALLVALVGVLVGTIPFVEAALLGVAITPIIDPFGALGLLGGGYPVAVGVAYLVVGGFAALLAGHEPLAYRPVSAAALAGLLPVWGATLAFYGVTPGTNLLAPRLLAFVAATGPVPLAFVVGLAPSATRRRLTAALATLLFVPYAALVVPPVVDGASMGEAFVALSAAILVVYALLWGYPLYRLGRMFETVRR